MTSEVLAAVLLLHCSQVSSAAGTWSVIPLPQQSGEVSAPWAVAVDAAGNLFVADNTNSRIQKRDTQGNWSMIATRGEIVGTVPGQVVWPTALAVDTAGNLYVADSSNSGSIRKRNAQGNWSVIAAYGAAPGQVDSPFALAMDTAGNLYVTDSSPYCQQSRKTGSPALLVMSMSGCEQADKIGI